MSATPSEFATTIAANLLSEFDGEGRSAEVERQIIAAYESHLAPVFTSLALLAVGGFGRRELFPSSDVDLLLLTETGVADDEQKRALGTFLRVLWDARLRPSHSIHTVAECCEFQAGNDELAISLLDERLIAGDLSLHARLRERFSVFVRERKSDLAARLAAMTRQRHARFHQTIYHLEPNVKETPGGVRDLHLVHWLTRLGIGTGEAEVALQAPRQFLFHLRAWLHKRSGRDQNVLTFDLQEEIASDPAAWMREYYRQARLVHRTALRELERSESLRQSGLFRQFLEHRKRLSNPDFTLASEKVLFRNPQALAANSELLWALFTFVARHGVRPHWEAERQVETALQSLGPFQNFWPALARILALPNAALAVRVMHECGFWLLLFPEWEGIECLVQRDFYHRYTVDEHTLIALEELGRLPSAPEPLRKRFAALWTEPQERPLLLASLLFHDTGKGGGLAGHAQVSGRLAEGALARAGMVEAQRREVVWLVDNHLALSSLVSSRDLNDPATARDAARLAGTLERLKQLVLVTYADISAVNPEAMTSWRLEQLWRLYSVTQRALTRELDAERISAPRAPFVDGFPTRYLLTHSDEEIKRHLVLEENRRLTGAAAMLERLEGSYRVTVVAKDRPGLFAALAGTLSSFGMNILRAEAFANRSGDVLDSFSFADPARTLELNPEEIARLTKTLERAALGKENIERLLSGRPIPPVLGRKRPQPRVSFDGNGERPATLVEVVAEDRPGLLYALATVFAKHGCSVEVVLIDTEANRVYDVFYVSEAGGKLGAAKMVSLEQDLLAAARN